MQSAVLSSPQRPKIMSRWLVNASPNPAAPVRLFCFSYAGGGASTYARWSADLPTDVDVWAVQLPGREGRFRDPVETRMPVIVEALVDAVGDLGDKPFAFFGHSLGGLIAFELARALGQRGLRGPRHLIVSGKQAPGSRPRRGPIYHLPDDRLIEELQRYNGTPKAILENSELMPLLLPMLRADVTLFDCYQYQASDPVGCPITAFGGDDDRFVAIEDLDDWHKQTSAEFRKVIFQGDHFFIHSRRAEVLDEVARVLES